MTRSRHIQWSLRVARDVLILSSTNFCSIKLIPPSPRSILADPFIASCTCPEWPQSKNTSEPHNINLNCQLPDTAGASIACALSRTRPRSFPFGVKSRLLSLFTMHHSVDTRCPIYHGPVCQPTLGEGTVAAWSTYLHTATYPTVFYREIYYETNAERTSHQGIAARASVFHSSSPAREFGMGGECRRATTGVLMVSCILVVVVDLSFLRSRLRCYWIHSV